MSKKFNTKRLPRGSYKVIAERLGTSKQSVKNVLLYTEEITTPLRKAVFMHAEELAAEYETSLGLPVNSL